MLPGKKFVVKILVLSTIMVSIMAEFTLSATPAMAQTEALPLKIIITSADSDVIVTKRFSGVTCHNQIIAGPTGIPLYTTGEGVPDGTTFNLGRFPVGTELGFLMIGDPVAYNGFCNGSYYTGPGWRNPDGLVHAKIDVLGPETLLVGFEDINGTLTPPDFNYTDALFEVSGGGVTVLNNEGGSATYRVTIKNVTQGQPFFIPIAVTHRPNVTVFKPDAPATRELREFVEIQNPYQITFTFRNMLGVTDVVGVRNNDPADIILPLLTPSGTSQDNLSDIVTFEIKANPDDRLSIVAGLLCTNDGFAGLFRQPLPDKGARVYEMEAYDAGTEANTELSADLADACSGMGLIRLDGDDNGNNNDGIDTPNDRVRKHPGIKKVGDLTDIHDFEQPVAFVIIERIK